MSTCFFLQSASMRPHICYVFHHLFLYRKCTRNVFHHLFLYRKICHGDIIMTSPVFKLRHRLHILRAMVGRPLGRSATMAATASANTTANPSTSKEINHTSTNKSYDFIWFFKSPQKLRCTCSQISFYFLQIVSICLDRATEWMMNEPTFVRYRMTWEGMIF